MSNSSYHSIMKSNIEKPWGSYQVLENTESYTLKKIIVNPGGKLSLQSHKHRSEHWIIAEGKAEIIIDEKVLIVGANESVIIPKGSKHRLTNNQNTKLIIFELWFGDILDEKDIVRYEDIYGRS